MSPAIFRRLSRALAERRPACLAIVVAPASHAGLSLLVGLDSVLAGEPPPEPLGSWLVERAQAALADRRTSIATAGPEVATGIEAYFEPYPARPDLVIVGGGHVGKGLYDLAAPLPLFDLTIVDDRPQYANATRFPLAATVCCGFEEVFSKIAVHADSYLVIVTRGHRADKLCLREALKTPARYIGMIGSRRKVLLTYRHLVEEGVDRLALDRVHAPVGLAIGASGAAEIAVSILAELIAVKNGVDPRSAGSLGRAVRLP